MALFLVHTRVDRHLLHITILMKRSILLLLTLLMALPLMAQKTRQQALLEYQARRRKAYTEFSANYRKACSEFMRKRWEAFRTHAPLPMPERKEPTAPIVKQPDAPTVPTPVQIPIDQVVDLRPTAPATPAGPTPKPATPTTPIRPATPSTPQKPATPAPQPKTDLSRPLQFTFYGTASSVTLKNTQKLRLSSLQENAVADAWDKIAGGSYDQAARECLELKKQLRLNDWGYYDLVRTVANAYYGNNTNESILLQSFLMAEGGYKMRLARGDNRLFLLLALSDKIYAQPYFEIDGTTFYLLDKGKYASSYNICNFSISGEKSLSLKMTDLPLLTRKAGTATTRKDKTANITTTVTPDLNLLGFLNNYPACDWEIYAGAKLSSATSSQLLPSLRQAIAGKSQREAADILLHYLHRAYSYKTDQQQFGIERTLFAEEMFGYPHSDCEDRSILYARLIEELLQLPVVLLYYPEHIATAVCFTEQVSGDYVQVGGRKYVVCDPTYMGADVGEAMPEYKKVSARIIRIN